MKSLTKDIIRCSLFLSLLFLTACSSWSLYRQSDCGYTPELYGQCFADQGYATSAFESLVGYCAKNGKTLSLEKYQLARDNRLKEICAQPEEVFRLSFRRYRTFSGLAVCPDLLLSTEVLKNAAKDGENAGRAYASARKYESDASEAEERRRKADEQAFIDGVADRILKADPDVYSKRAIEEEAKFQKILAQYPKLKEPYLTERLKCTPQGFY